ncbi:hypothetical protein VNO78_19492 [Psophocarpus tetragonolobus]|uniref:Uncharacterized protein n=1 Tax=Psophocarpus tetragonolobus TaxID=3891 RepID=A0AAN9XGB8_PSOTE
MSKPSLEKNGFICELGRRRDVGVVAGEKWRHLQTSKEKRCWNCRWRKMASVVNSEGEEVPKKLEKKSFIYKLRSLKEKCQSSRYRNRCPKEFQTVKEKS